MEEYRLWLQNEPDNISLRSEIASRQLALNRYREVGLSARAG